MNEHSFGVIPIWQDGDMYEVLLIKQKKGKWGFPKGRVSPSDTDGVATALRELAEETGITECDLKGDISFCETYRKNVADSHYQKRVEYYLGFVEKSEIEMQIEEIADYQWLDYEAALKLITYENTKEILREVNVILIT